MKFLNIYKNGELYGRKLSVQQLINVLDKKYYTIREVPVQGNEIARIVADNDIYTIFK